MRETSERRLKVEEAARLIYRTPEPSVVQISKIRYKLAEGVLHGSAKGDWVTSRSVAEYMAARSRQAANKARQPQEAAQDGVSEEHAVERYVGPLSAGAAPFATRRTDGQLPSVYQELLRDYFLAVILRKRPPRSNTLFNRVVLLSQIALVIFPLLVVGTALTNHVGPSSEQTAVKRWIGERTDRYAIEEWFPPQANPAGAGTVLRVRYEYFDGGSRAIHTDRRFLVVGETVTELFGD